MFNAVMTDYCWNLKVRLKEMMLIYFRLCLWKPLKKHSWSHTHTHTHKDRKTLSLYSRQCQPIRRLITLTNSPDTSARSGIPDIPGDTRAETKTMADDHSLDVWSSSVTLEPLFLAENKWSHISSTTAGHFQTKCGVMSIWLHFN